MTKKIKINGKHAVNGREYMLVDDADYDMLIKYKWHLKVQRVKNHRCYYVPQTTIGEAKNGWYKKKNIKAHYIIMSKKDGYVIDHINHNPLDNRRKNLRYVTSSQNSANSRLRINSTSGYKGVSFSKQKGKWRARVGKKHAGFYQTAIEAAKAYDKVAKEMYGKYAQLNFPN